MAMTGAAHRFWALLLACLAIKLWLAAQMPLFGDEAFYWLESRHPAAAHDDVPALTPTLIGLGVAVMGDHPLAVRLPFLLLAAFSACYLAWIGGRTFGAEAGWRAGTAALLLPLFAVNGVLALPDVPLTLAVLVGLDALLRLHSGHRGGAVLLVLALALGWQSHYRFAVPFAAAGLWMLASRDGRALLRQPRVWLAGTAGTVLGTAPLLAHQLAGGSGFAFQFVERHPWQWQPEHLLDPFWQALVTTPLLYLFLLWALCWGWRRGWRGSNPVLGGFAIALLACFFLLGLLADAERSRLHWPVPGYLAAMLLLPPLLAGAGAAWRRGYALALTVAGTGVVLAFGYLVVTALVPARLAQSNVYPHGFTGWGEAQRLVADALQRMPPDTVLAADHFMLAAQLGFAQGGARPVFSLDHPINRKHGRQRELERMGLDEAGLRVATVGRPMLLVIEESASRLRARPGWFRGICERFPQARPVFDAAVDHGRKRLIGYANLPAADAACVPPAVGYLETSTFGQRGEGRLVVSGWALRDRDGLRALRAMIDGAPVAELAAVDAPGVSMLFPGSDDPRHPRVGFHAVLHPELAKGRHWLQIEAEGHDGQRAIVAAVPFDWVPAADDTAP